MIIPRLALRQHYSKPVTLRLHLQLGTVQTDDQILAGLSIHAIDIDDHDNDESYP